MLLYCDGFDSYSSLASRWPFLASVGHTTPGRFSNGAVTSSFSNQALGRPLAAPASTLIAGVALRVAAYAGQTPIMFLSGGTSQLYLQVNGLGQIIVGRGGTVLGTSPLSIALNAWYYIELKATFSTTVGSFELRIDGITQAQGSGVNTAGAGGTTADTIYLAGGGPNPGGGWTIDDHYLCDGSGTVNNDFLGDVRVSTLMPNGVGTHSDFTRGGTDTGANWSQVDEAPPNDDTTYVVSSTPGNIDTYTMDDLPVVAGSVFGVQIGIYARKDDAGSRSLASVARSGATEVVGPTIPLPSSYVYQFDVRENKPGGTGWTIADVNAMEIGAEVIT